MKLNLLHLLVILFLALVAYDLFMSGRPKKRVRFNLQPTILEYQVNDHQIKWLDGHIDDTK